MFSRFYRKSRSYIALLIIVAMTLGLFVPGISVSAAEIVSFGSGQVLYSEQFDFAPNAIFTKYISNNPSLGVARAFSIEIQPGGSAKLIASVGDSVTARQTLSQAIKSNSSSSQKIIAGINGDFYDTKTGVPIGPVIRNGKLLSSSPDNYPAIGIFDDGTAFISDVKMRIAADVNSGQASFRIMDLNKNLGSIGLFMFSEDHGKNTKTSKQSYDVVIEIISGELAIGKKLDAKIVDIRDNSIDAQLQKGQLVISAEKNDQNTASLEQLQKLVIGDNISISIEDVSENNGKWQYVKEAIGGGQQILKNSEVTTTDASVHPRTAVGIKADGTVVLLVVDGRQAGYSTGMNLIDIANYFLSMGCVAAINMDGGGSSTIAARIPGSYEATIINKPSEGSERMNSNTLLLAVPASDIGSLAHIHTSPIKVLMMPGAQVPINIKATDNTYQPVILSEPAVWEVTGNIGNVDGGIFTAGAQAEKGSVKAKIGDIYGETQIEIITDFQLSLNKASISLRPDESYDFNISIKKEILPVVSQDKLFTWTVEGDVGTIDENGVFKAAIGRGQKGKITASYGNNNISADIYVSSLPITLEDFEDGVDDWKALGDRLPINGVSISSESAYEYVPFGNKAMKLQYNMTGGTSGTSGAYAAKDIAIDGYPTHISMWVYGDGKGSWLRAQLRDGDNNAFNINLTNQTTGVDWVGWKYVEAEIPSGKKLPLTIDRAVRLMQTEENKKTDGVIYIDNIRAIYGYKNDDMSPPMIDAIYPTEGSLLTAHTSVRISLSDNIDITDTGIDPKSIMLYIDDVQVQDYVYNSSDSSVQFSTSKLINGKHKFTMYVRDIFGNKSSKTWFYTIDTGAAALYSKMIENEAIYAGGEYVYSIKVKNPAKGFSKLDITLKYNPELLQIIDLDTSKEGIQVGLGDALKGSKILTNDVKDGVIRLSAENISADKSSENVLHVSFRVRGSAQGKAGLLVEKCLVNDNTSYIDPLDTLIKNKLKISVDGLIKDNSSTIHVSDVNGAAVSDALLLVNGRINGQITDKNGDIISSKLTNNPVGTVLRIQAVRGGFYSNILEIKITNPLESSNP